VVAPPRFAKTRSNFPCAKPGVAPASGPRNRRHVQQNPVPGGTSTPCEFVPLPPWGLGAGKRAFSVSLGGEAAAPDHGSAVWTGGARSMSARVFQGGMYATRTDSALLRAACSRNSVPHGLPSERSWLGMQGR
jgi:hypothetical protein